jgi:Na+-translocating ferredoxin:NAD+ oxidoreductase RNF subunit RnfB
MNVTAIIIAALVVGAVGIILGFFLGISGEKFKVEVDPREEAILEVLPGNNCGGCGYAGCSGLAAAIAKTSSSILCFTHDEVAAFEPQACINCGRCVEACPEQLIPSRLAKFGLRGQMDEFEKWHGLECIECGSCSFACPSRRQVAQPIKTMKKLVLAEKRKQASKK